MVQQQQRFNLIDEKWINVERANGTRDKISLLEAFKEADDIRRVVTDLPQAQMPVLRLMLAVLYRAYQNPGAFAQQTVDLWLDTWDAGHFDMARIESYLDRVHDGFYLIGGSKPFMQEAGLEYQDAEKNKPDGIGKLIVDLPDKDSKFLFSLRSKGSVKSVPFSDAVPLLLVIQAYDCAGIKTPISGSKTSKKGKEYAPKGQISTGPLGFGGGLYLERSNLFETLMMNWVMYVKTGEKPFLALADDLPTWEREPSMSMGRRSLTGPADLFTFCSRRVLLIPSEDDEDCVAGVVIGYGASPDPNDLARFETMTLWRPASKKQADSLNIPENSPIPKTHDPEKALWRGLSSVLPFTDGSSTVSYAAGVIAWVNNLLAEDDGDTFEDSYLPRVVVIHAQGIAYGTQNSVYSDSVDEQLDLNRALLNEEDVSALSASLDVLRRIEFCVGELAKSVTKAHGLVPNETMRNRYLAFSAGVRADAYQALDALSRAYLRSIDDNNADKLKRQWCDDAHRLLIQLANRYFEDVGGSWISFRNVGDSQLALGEQYIRLLSYFANADKGFGPFVDSSDADFKKEA